MCVSAGTLEMTVLAIPTAAASNAVAVGAGFAGLSAYAMPVKRAAPSGAAGSGTAGQGATFLIDIFSSLVNITTIKTLTARFVTTANNNLTGELRFNYGD